MLKKILAIIGVLVSAMAVSLGGVMLIKPSLITTALQNIKEKNSSASDARDENADIFAFYVSWDENSKISLKKNINKIDVVIPEWFHLNGDMTISSNKQIEIDTFIQKSGVKEMPLINNYINSDWDGKVVHNMISSKEKRTKFINEMSALVKSGGYYGINIDFENISSNDKSAYTEFMKELCSSFHNSGYFVSVDLPPESSETFDYEAISGYSDYLIIMLYDEHYSTGTPGAVASRKWFNNQLESVISEISKKKMIAGLANYGYDWIVHSDEPAEEITYSAALDISKKKNIKIIRDSDKLNPHFTYKDGEDTHSVWFMDSATLYNELEYSINKGIHNVALWRLGAEDPAIWNFLNNGKNAQ